MSDSSTHSTAEAPVADTIEPENDVSTSPIENSPIAVRQTDAVWEAGKYITSVLVLLAGAASMVGLAMLKKEPADQPKDQLIQLVSTVNVESYAGELDMVVSGSVVPFREIRVGAEVSGNIIKKYPACEAGNFVRSGEKLFEIDPKDYELQLETRKAEVAQAERMLNETEKELEGAQKNLLIAEKDYQIARSEFDRNQRIKQALSSAELDQSKRNLLNIESSLTTRKNALDLIAARVDRMQAAVKLSKSQLDRADLNLKKTVIVAPDDGIVVMESVQEGEFVNTGMQLLTIEDTRKSEVICNLSPRDLEWIRKNSPLDPEAAKKIEENSLLAVYYLPKTAVSIFEPENEDIVWNGVLERFDGVGRDNRTRTIPTRITIAKPVIEVDDRPHALVRGMYVKCRITVPVSAGDDGQRFAAFPEVALRPGGYVWSLTDDRKLKKVPVTVVDRGTRLVGNAPEKFVVLRLDENSLRVGQAIVETPIPQAVEGMVVQLEGEEVKGEAKGQGDSESNADQPSSADQTESITAPSESPGESVSSWGGQPSGTLVDMIRVDSHGSWLGNSNEHWIIDDVLLKVSHSKSNRSIVS